MNRNPSRRKSKKIKTVQKAEITEAANIEINRLISHIRQKRTALGYSQDEVAAFLDVHLYKYQRIEARKTNDFKVYDFIKLCILLEIDYI